MLSDDDNLKQLPSNKRRAIDASGRSWSDSQKLEAVTTFLSLGSITLTSRVLKIPEMTLRTWKNKDWWKELEADLKTQESLELSSRLKKIIGSTLAVAEDRIANGDFIYDNRTGQMLRKPVSLKDAHKVTMDMIQRREVLDNKQPTNVSMEQLDDKLAKLAQKFEQIAAGRRTIEVTDVIIGLDVSNGAEVPDGMEESE